MLSYNTFLHTHYRSTHDTQHSLLFSLFKVCLREQISQRSQLQQHHHHQNRTSLWDRVKQWGFNLLSVCTIKASSSRQGLARGLAPEKRDDDRSTQQPPPRRRLLIKSPVHTARVPLLRRLFPRASFVYLHRHPGGLFNYYYINASIHPSKYLLRSRVARVRAHLYPPIVISSIPRPSIITSNTHPCNTHPCNTYANPRSTHTFLFVFRGDICLLCAHG